MEFITLLILLGITIQCGADTELPDFIIPCKASDEECLRKAIQALKPHLENGIPEFQLPSITSLYVPGFNQTKNFVPDLAYDASLTNIKFDGVNNYNVSKISVDLDRLKFHLVINFSLLNVTSYQNISGIVFGFSIHENWEGILRFKAENVTVHLSLDGSYVLKEGKQYVVWKEREINVTSGLTIINVEDLIKNKEIRSIFLKTLEANREGADEESRLFIKSSLAKYIVHVINIVHDLYPLDILYTKEG